LGTRHVDRIYLIRFLKGTYTEFEWNFSHLWKLTKPLYFLLCLMKNHL
jgi:hypothetical protein